MSQDYKSQNPSWGDLLGDQLPWGWAGLESYSLCPKGVFPRIDFGDPPPSTRDKTPPNLKIWTLGRRYLGNWKMSGYFQTVSVALLKQILIAIIVVVISETHFLGWSREQFWVFPTNCVGYTA